MAEFNSVKLQLLLNQSNNSEKYKVFSSDKALCDALGWQHTTVTAYWTSCIFSGSFCLQAIKRERWGLSMKLPKSLSWFLCSDFQCFTAFWKPFRWKHVSSIAGSYDTVNSSRGWQDSSWDCGNWWHLDGNETKGNCIDYFLSCHKSLTSYFLWRLFAYCFSRVSSVH